MEGSQRGFEKLIKVEIKEVAGFQLTHITTLYAPQLSQALERDIALWELDQCPFFYTSGAMIMIVMEYLCLATYTVELLQGVVGVLHRIPHGPGQNFELKRVHRDSL